MKRKILTAIAILLFLTIVQFITYNTIANDKLAKQAIKNLEVNPQITSDTIIFGSVITVRWKQELKHITPYNLHLTNREHFKLLKKKLAPSTIIEEAEYGKYYEKIFQEAYKHMDSAQFEMFVDHIHSNESKLYITALEEQKFFVTVNYNWIKNRESFYEENHYIWVFFSWLKI